MAGNVDRPLLDEAIAVADEALKASHAPEWWPEFVVGATGFMKAHCGPDDRPAPGFIPPNVLSQAEKAAVRKERIINANCFGDNSGFVAHCGLVLRLEEGLDSAVYEVQVDHEFGHGNYFAWYEDYQGIDTKELVGSGTRERNGMSWGDLACDIAYDEALRTIESNGQKRDFRARVGA